MREEASRGVISPADKFRLYERFSPRAFSKSVIVLLARVKEKKTKEIRVHRDFVRGYDCDGLYIIS